MNTHRRLLAAILIALSWLFAIQPAGAVTAQATSSDDQLCGVTGTLPETFPTWLEVQLRANDDCVVGEDNANLLAADASLQPLCVNNAPLPDDVPTWIVVRELANDDCFVEEANTDLVASGLNTDACANVGPTMFKLGLGTASAPTVALSVPPCFTAEAVGAPVVQVPIEGSIVAMNDQPGVGTEVTTASSGESNLQDVLRGQPGEIGPTI